MKHLSLILIILILSIAIYQRFVIHNLSETLASNSVLTTEHFQTTRVHSKPKKQLSTPPLGNADSPTHLNFLQEVSQATNPAERAQTTILWTANLTSPQALQTALSALLDPSLSHEERVILSGRFGPGLFARWGQIDPQGGLDAWSALDKSTRLALLGEDCSPNHKSFATYTFPLPLLQAWAAHNPSELLKNLPHLPANYPKEVFTLLAETQPLEMLRYLDQFDSIDYPSPRHTYDLDENKKIKRIESSIHPEERNVLKAHSISKIGDTLLLDHKTLDNALDSLKSLPQSESRNALNLELLTRSIKNTSPSLKDIETTFAYLTQAPEWARRNFIYSLMDRDPKFYYNSPPEAPSPSIRQAIEKYLDTLPVHESSDEAKLYQKWLAGKKLKEPVFVSP